MSDHLDLERLRDIPDPFAASGAPAPRKLPALGASPTRGQARRNRTAAVGCVVLYEVGWVALIEHRRDLGSLSAFTLALGLVIPLAAAALALGAVAARGRRRLGVSVSWLALLSTLPPVLFAVATLATSPADTDPGRFWD